MGMSEAVFGVEICDSRTFLGLGILQLLFFGKRLWRTFWGLTKNVTQGSHFQLKQSYQFHLQM